MRFARIVVLVVVAVAEVAHAEELDPDQKLTRDILEELVEIDTSPAQGTTKAAVAVKRRLLAAGFPAADIQLVGKNPRKLNLVFRLRGRGKRAPLLLLAHLDVVEARREDWSTDPFQFVEKDGWYYGRGTGDDKGMAAVWVALILRFRREGYVPDRDLIVALTADEEGGKDNGVDWILANQPRLIEAELCLNEGGGGIIDHGKYVANEVQGAEKVYQSFDLEVRDKGGHSSVPGPESTIYRLARGLLRIEAFRFPAVVSEITRGYFEVMSRSAPPAVARDMRAVARPRPDAGALARLSKTPFFNALLRTTCVATRLDAGHADNALPQTARAVVNCRGLPGVEADELLAVLVKVLGDPAIAVTFRDEKAVGSPPSKLHPELMKAARDATQALWPGVPVVPTMSTGATDGARLRRHGMPVFGVSGYFEDIDDIRAHGKDERVGQKELRESYEFLRLVVIDLSSG